MNRINVLEYGACNDGSKITTKCIQRAIDDAYKSESEVYIPRGIYLISSIFLKSNVSLFLDDGAVLLGIAEETEYPIVFTRVAGVEMQWYAGIINITDCENVKICGNGIVDGQGEYWWNKYWGQDRKGGMRSKYEEQGLRWAVDYDCKRVRNVVVFNSNKVELLDFSSRRSGFWNVHICYSENVHINSLNIDENQGPSTDGIDIDSCNNVLVENCKISCNDDNICIKSGRDADGLRVNRVCKNIIIKNCKLYKGAGITLGSETSGGIKCVEIENIGFKGTDCGFRIKSAKTRGGTIEDIKVNNLYMHNVKCAFCFEFNWHPLYSYCNIPDNYTDSIPEHWNILLEQVSDERGLPHANGIEVSNVVAENVHTAFNILGLKESPFDNFVFNNISINAEEHGEISNINGLIFNNVAINLK